jgi:NAD(P)-dependent dehydrogenase (short-subunit alcohol dehydrogenase family)
MNLADRQIRVNAVALGPVSRMLFFLSFLPLHTFLKPRFFLSRQIWTPLIPATFPGEKMKQFGTNTPMKRYARQVDEQKGWV